MCFELPYFFADTGVGTEPIWPEAVATDRPAYAHEVTLMRYDTDTGGWSSLGPYDLIDDPNNPDAGCIFSQFYDLKSTPTSPVIYYPRIYSRGEADGHEVVVGNCNTPATCVQSVWTPSITVDRNAPYSYVTETVWFSPVSDAFQVLGTASFTLNTLDISNHGPITFPFWVGGTSNRYANGVIELTAGGATRKYLIPHELTHRLMWEATTWEGGRCDEDAQPQPIGEHGHDPIDGMASALPCRPLAPGHGEHHMVGLEAHRCAFSEGIAQAVAAEVWNDGDIWDCSFTYAKGFPSVPQPPADAPPQLINCSSYNVAWESPPHEARYPLGDMINQCPGVFGAPHNWPSAGHGREMDWMRTLYTTMHPLAGNALDFRDLFDWIAWTVNLYPSPGSLDDHSWYSLFAFSALIYSADHSANFNTAATINGLQ